MHRIGCTLRSYCESDRQPVGELFSDPAVMRFVGDGRPVEVDKRQIVIEHILEKHRTDPSFYLWAIEECGQYAGHAELKRRNGRTEYELVYILQRRRWGRGLGGAVVDLLLENARCKNIPFVIATVHAENFASIAILKRRGFVRDGNISAELKTEAFMLALQPDINEHSKSTT